MILSKNQPANPFAGILPKPRVVKAFKESVRAFIIEITKPSSIDSSGLI